jgi:cobalt/nickel transport system permease protein
MHFDAFDRYQATESALHRLDPRVKVVLAVAFILSNALLPDGAWLAFAMSWLFVLAGNDMARLGLGYTFMRSFIALPFALAAVSAIFSPLGSPLFSFQFLWMDLAVTDFGLVRFLSILARSWLSVQVAILLVATTQFPDLIHAFEHLRVPRVLTTIIAFLYRYLFVLTDEVFRLLRARQARSAGTPGQKQGRNVFWRAQVTGAMAGQLFLRSYERSERIYHAMLSRGYTGHVRTINPHQMTSRDWLVLGIGLSALVFSQLVGWIR